ncbi:GNAT family N-acetyltransferase [Sphingopyxis sp.]|uniref:GNAT family N-acetyltransferase n=1 Tax=Sphingopyxis sp. TaxID=1908224 RepID=UPI003F71F979
MNDIELRDIVADDFDRMLHIINCAAEAYRGVIPPDRWHEPYMPAEALASEMADGVLFSGCFADGQLVGVMGVQDRGTVDLIRHAYVMPDRQGSGIGGQLLQHICRARKKPILIGTWQAADWAIRFYERHGFARVASDDAAALLRTFWNIPERQIETSVVLASEILSHRTVQRLSAARDGQLEAPIRGC